MDPLSIYWNSVWQDAQRAQIDGAAQKGQGKRTISARRRAGRGARHGTGPMIGITITILAVGTIFAVM